MHIATAYFNDFDQFYEAAIDWQLDFRLLSRNNFKAYLSMYATETVQIARLTLNGTIEQHGLVPPGFSCMVIPANLEVEYNWLHKDVDGNQILIFPAEGVLDSISFDNFDVFVISVENNLLFNWLEHSKYKKAEKIFGGNEKFIRVNPFFIKNFSDKVEFFLKGMSESDQINPSDKLAEQCQVNDILFELFQFLENGNQLIMSSPERKRDLALNRSLEIIQYDIENIPDVKGLCRQINISQRTLEYAFLEKFKITPKAYIKAQQLHKIKKEIQSEQSRGFSISTIAGKYGFWHMGQFAADFKNHFGVLPSELKKTHFK